MKTKLKLISSSILVGSLMAGVAPAYAQESNVLEMIIVTAQKRTQDVRDVSAVVNVVSGDEIDRLNLFSFEDIERVTSGLQLTQGNPRNATIALRGVTVDPESGTESAVDVYHNNVTQRNDNVFGAIYDLERVEVLKGPQGSIQGATSPGGAIIIHTKKPSLDSSDGYVRTSFTRGVNGTNLQAAYGTPIIEDKLAIRIAAFDNQTDQHNVTNIITGNLQDADTTSFRGSLRWAPSENFELNLVHQNNDQTTLGTPRLEGNRTGASAFGGVAGIPCGFVPAGVDSRSCRPVTARDRVAMAGADTYTEKEADITTLNVDWTIGDHQLSYIYGLTDSTKTSNTENDASYNLPLQNYFYAAGLGVNGDTNYRTNQGTVTTVDADVHELRFASVDNEKWNYMVGLYSRDQKTRTEFESWSTAARYLPLSIANSPFSPIVFTGGHIEGINFSTGGSIPFNSTTEAIFTAHEFKVGQNTTLEAALRYQEVSRFNRTQILFGEYNQPGNISIQNLSAISLSPLIPPAFVPGTANFIAQQVLQGTLASIASTNIEGVPTEFQDQSDDSTTGRLAVKHDFSDDFNAYLSYSESFRQGGISIVPGAAIGAADLLFDSESSDAIELGFKGVFLDGRAEVNVALFQQNFDGFLGYVTDLDYVTPSGSIEALTGGLVFNGDAKTTGLDLDWRMATSENWLWGGSLSYVDATFDNAQVPCNIREPGEQVGRCASSDRIAGTPELTSVLFGEFSRELSGMEFYARGNAKYNGGILSTRAVEFGSSAGETDSYMLLDFVLGLRSDKWALSVFAKNVLNDDADLDLTNSGDNFDVNDDFREVRQLAPRSYGVTVQYNF